MCGVKQLSHVYVWNLDRHRRKHMVQLHVIAVRSSSKQVQRSSHTSCACSCIPFILGPLLSLETRELEGITLQSWSHSPICHVCGFESTVHLHLMSNMLSATLLPLIVLKSSGRAWVVMGSEKSHVCVLWLGVIWDSKTSWPAFTEAGSIGAMTCCAHQTTLCSIPLTEQIPNPAQMDSIAGDAPNALGFLYQDRGDCSQHTAARCQGNPVPPVLHQPPSETISEAANATVCGSLRLLIVLLQVKYKEISL